MKNYKCQRCGYTTAQKTHFKNHLSRKNPCECINSNIEISILKDEFFEKKNEHGFKCDYCDKLFTSSQGKYQHKKLCKENPINKEELPVQSSEINELKREIDELKNLIMKNTNNNNMINNTTNNNQQLKLDLQYYKNRKNENFYQLLLENYLGGNHKTLSCGITDITTDSCHAEIKEWSSWKEAIGQLTCYNTVDPKEKLEMYMFGKYKQSCKDEAIKVTTSCKINIYEFVDTYEGVSIISLENNEEIYKYKPE